MEVLRPSLP